ncbi:MAG: hypothetical protein PHR36_04445 [Patescibacteria group bacterium]|nr:hypothetical protein [Patescibacteria group bacterium]
MKKSLFFFGLIIAALLLVGAGCAPKPAKVGEACGAKKICDTGLKCISNLCSSGQIGSACVNYKDCQSGLYCLKSACANPPSYKKYFDKITISKMKQGMPPGPNNIPVPTTEFKTTDAIEIDVVATKDVAAGTIYYDLVNSTTGEIEMSSANNKQTGVRGNWGTGFGIPGNLSGDYDLNLYFNDELVYTTPITISK